MTWKTGGCILFALLFAPCNTWAVVPLDAMAVETLRDAQQVQKLAKEWDDHEKKIRAEILALEERSNRLSDQLERLDQAVVIEEQRITQQRRRLSESLRLREGLLDWLQDVDGRLEQVKGQGLPFLAAERQRRLADLREVLADPHVPLYEQFRRVFEVLLVETEYGHSSEVYRDSVFVDGEELQVDLLRVGRLALFFRTLDGKKTGVFDPATEQFRWLDEDALGGISRAFAVVRRETAPEMVTLPVGRIVRP